MHKRSANLCSAEENSLARFQNFSQIFSLLLFVDRIQQQHRRRISLFIIIINIITSINILKASLEINTSLFAHRVKSRNPIEYSPAQSINSRSPAATINHPFKIIPRLRDHISQNPKALFPALFIPLRAPLIPSSKKRSIKTIHNECPAHKVSREKTRRKLGA